MKTVPLVCRVCRRPITVVRVPVDSEIRFGAMRRKSQKTKLAVIHSCDVTPATELAPRVTENHRMILRPRLEARCRMEQDNGNPC